MSNKQQVSIVLRLAKPALAFALALCVNNSSAQGLQPAALAIARTDVNGTNSLASTQPQVSLEAREEGGSVSALLGLAFGADHRGSLALKLTGALDKDAQERDLANRSDLPGGVQGTLSFSYALPLESEGSSDDLTPLCRHINDLLSVGIPRLDDAVLEHLRKAQKAEGKERYEHYTRFWGAFLEARLERDRYLAPRVEAGTATAQEKLELDALSARKPPTLKELEAAAVAPLCMEWNKGRMEKLLVSPFHGQAGEVSLRGSQGSCDLSTLVQARAQEVVLKAETEAKQAQDKAERVALNAEALAVREADSVLETAKAAVEAEIAAAAADGPAAEAAARRNAETALFQARIRHAELLERARRERARSIALADEAAVAAVQTAKSKELKTIYETATKTFVDAINAWNGADIPFLRTPPDEVADITCDDQQVLALLGRLEGPDRRAVYRGLLRALPSLGFITVDYKNASQDFKFVKSPIDVDPDSASIRSESTNEHNQAGRVGFSLFRRGLLWTAGIGEKRQWKSSATAQFCAPLDENGNQTCSTLASGRPTRKETRIYDVQVKSQFSPSFAALAQVFYEDEENILNPHVVLYFLPEKEKLRGGIDLAYVSNSPRDSENGFKARLFVGVPFSFIP